jgi:hypothetical protein
MNVQTKCRAAATTENTSLSKYGVKSVYLQVNIYKTSPEILGFQGFLAFVTFQRPDSFAQYRALVASHRD